MTLETTIFFAKGEKCLVEAEVMLSIELSEAASRTAYYAAFQAAQALIFERTGKAA